MARAIRSAQLETRTARLEAAEAAQAALGHDRDGHFSLGYARPDPERGMSAPPMARVVSGPRRSASPTTTKTPTATRS